MVADIWGWTTVLLRFLKRGCVSSPFFAVHPMLADYRFACEPEGWSVSKSITVLPAPTLETVTPDLKA